ncbi:MAG: hypothetical protein ACREEM_32470 [Blastocatellia bacterium]
MMCRPGKKCFNLNGKFAAAAVLILLMLSALILFSPNSRAQTATIPLGSYTAVVPQDARVGNLVFPGGEYQLTLLAGGRHQLGRNNFITLSGAHTVSGNQVRFASPATMDTCSGEGTYLWAVAGNRLALTAATARIDSCVERIVIGNTLYRTTDNGQTWRQPEGGALPTGTGWLMDATGGNLYASNFAASGAIRSTDEGRTWQYVNAGFDTRWGIRWFADGGKLYAGTPNGVYVSNSLVNRAATVSAASFRPSIASRAIVAAFGPNLATRGAMAGGQPLPTELAGTTVRVRDSLGVERLALLFFVSAEQVNYQIPAGTAAGLAAITITNADGIGATGELNVTATAPAIFTATASGTGPAIAVDALTGAPPPFNPTRASGEPNIISVFGTGLGADATDVDANVAASVQANIGGRAATVQYAGRAPGFVGLNQFNIALPAGLASGTHTLIVARGGVASNAVTITIK